MTKIEKPKIAILGLTYKENTHSIKNSPSIALLNKIQGHFIATFDPAAEMDAVGQDITRTEFAIDATEQADVLLVMTPWPEFHNLTAANLVKSMSGRVVIDPYQVLDGIDLVKNGFIYATLGEPIRQPLKVSN